MPRTPKQVGVWRTWVLHIEKSPLEPRNNNPENQKSILQGPKTETTIKSLATILEPKRRWVSEYPKSPKSPAGYGNLHLPCSPPQTKHANPMLSKNSSGLESSFGSRICASGVTSIHALSTCQSRRVPPLTSTEKLEQSQSPDGRQTPRQSGNLRQPDVLKEARSSRSPPRTICLLNKKGIDGLGNGTKPIEASGTHLLLAKLTVSKGRGTKTNSFSSACLASMSRRLGMREARCAAHGR